MLGGVENPELSPANPRDLSAAEWIRPRLTGAFGAVTRAVPDGYAAYARICHPAEDPQGRLVTWTDVAAVTGRQPHPTMQWHALVGSADPVNMEGSSWPGGDPERGHLVSEVLRPLCDVLTAHTTTAQTCYFCLWDGWGGIPRDRLPVSRLSHPGRNYLVFVGPLRAALTGRRPEPDWFEPQSPNLFWPADRAWCVATEIDFDSTLVGGSPELIEQLLAHPGLDAWPVHPDDSLAADADRVNPVP